MWRILIDGGEENVTRAEAVNVLAWLSLTACSPAIHQRKSCPRWLLPQIAAAPSAWVPDWETFGADLNSAPGRATPADGQTHRWGKAMFAGSQGTSGHCCTSLAQQTNSQKSWLIPKDTKINQTYKPCSQGACRWARKINPVNSKNVVRAQERQCSWEISSSVRVGIRQKEEGKRKSHGRCGILGWVMKHGGMKACGKASNRIRAERIAWTQGKAQG